MYVCIYMCVCVCVCVFKIREGWSWILEGINEQYKLVPKYNTFNKKHTLSKNILILRLKNE